MKHRGPLVTLLVTAAAFAVLVVANVVQSDGGADAQAPAATGSPAPSGPPPTVATLDPGTAPTAPPSTVTLEPTTPAPTTQPPTTEPPATQPPTGFPAKATYAGRTADRRATIAIAVLNGRAAGYFCDGRSIEAWLTGTASGGVVTLRSKAGDTVRAQLTDGSLAGTIQVAGRTLSFDADAAKAPAGVYRGRGSAGGATTTIGWIILPDGSQVGISSAAGRRTPAPRLDPARGAVVVGNTVIPADPVSGATVF